MIGILQKWSSFPCKTTDIPTTVHGNMKLAGRLSYLLLWLFGALIQYGACAKSMFDICDSDGSKKISNEELGICLNMLPEIESASDAAISKVYQLMKLMDKNGDGGISLTEFQKVTEKVSESFDLDDYVDVTLVDGTVKKIHKSEMFNNVKDSTKGFEMKNDKIYKQSTESGLVSELADKDKALGNMIRVGKWAASELVNLTYASGSLLNLESLPNGGSVVDKNRLDKEPELLGVRFAGQFEVWLKLKMGVAGAAVPNITFFEVHVEYNKEKYRSPYLAILEAWVLEVAGDAGSGAGSTKVIRAMPLDLPLPRVRTTFTAFLTEQLQMYASRPYAGIVAAVFVLLFILTIFI